MIVVSRRPLALRITPIAERDLAEIWAYIADDSEKATTAFIAQLEAKFEPLLHHPGRCRDNRSGRTRGEGRAGAVLTSS